MSAFFEFEKRVLRLLCSVHLGHELVEQLIEGGELVSYEYSGVGYFLTVRHPALPVARALFDSPLVIGRSGNVEGGFLAFVENSELMLECYTAGAIEVDEKFRERHVDVAAVLPGTQLRSLRSLDDAR